MTTERAETETSFTKKSKAKVEVDNAGKAIMDNLIQWPEAKYWNKPWNPWLGCKRISPACDNCYARASSERFNCPFDPHETSKQNPPRRGVVFCGNMTDLFGEWIDAGDAIDLIRRTMGFSHKATYLWLTKRPEKMCVALKKGTLVYCDEDGDHESPFFDCEFQNQFFGFTAENQEWYDKRFHAFRSEKPDWANGWLSAEPLLGPICLRLGSVSPEFKWVVVGCESGPHRRPCKIEWVEEVVYQAMRRDIPVFVKQLDIDGKCVRDINRFPEHLRIRQVPWK